MQTDCTVHWQYSRDPTPTPTLAMPRQLTAMRRIHQLLPRHDRRAGMVGSGCAHSCHAIAVRAVPVPLAVAGTPAAAEPEGKPHADSAQ